MLNIKQTVQSVAGVTPEALVSYAQASTVPLIFKGAVAHWPLVQASLQSPEQASQYLCDFYQNMTVGAFYSDTTEAGRVFYTDDLAGINYQKVITKLNLLLNKILQLQQDDKPPMVYLGATSVDTCLPGLRADNDLLFGEIQPLTSIWIGNQTTIAAHNDLPDNMACVVAGHRRFTLFPPAQISNLYIGPLDFTPAGRPISLVDFNNPDFEKFPRFREALEHAQVAELAAGDVLFIPSMWWHQVVAHDPFNILVNYWWRQSPAYMDTPVNALHHALLAVRDLPPAQREAWRQVFDHYVFSPDAATVEHIPATARGILGPHDETMARKIRAELLNSLKR
jgi:hypothetical protein